MPTNDVCWTENRAAPGLLPWQSYTLAIVIGAFGLRFPVPALCALGLLCVAEWTLRGKACRLPVLVFICCAVFGYGYAVQRAPVQPDTVPQWMESRTPVVVRAVVDRVEPRSVKRQRVVLRDVVCETENGEERLPGKLVWSRRHPHTVPTPGQTVKTVLRVIPTRNFGNPGSWDYEWYWQRQSVLWRAWSGSKNKPQWGRPPEDLLWRLKTGMREKVAAHLPETQGGAMVLALTTGDKSLLDVATVSAARRAGLAHTLALSGLHVGFVASLGFVLAYVAGWLFPSLLLVVPRPKLAVLLAAPLVLAYAWIGQPSASLIRAAVMYGTWGVLLLQGRSRVLLDGLFFALAAMVFVSPLSVYDLSLQMSVTAVAGIGLIMPHIRPLFYLGGGRIRRTLGWAGGILAMSVSANIALLPLVSWYFGTWSPNILLNVLWLPVLGGVAMPLGLAGMIFASFSWTVPLGGLLLTGAASCMDGLLFVLHQVVDGGLTPVFAVLRPLWPEILGCGLLLISVLAVWRSDRKVPVGLAAIGFTLMVVPHVLVMAEDTRNEIRLTMLDVGLGQSLVVSVPGGRRWLVDAGGGTRLFDIGEAVVAPSLTHGRPPRLEGVFMTHPDVDHSHGIPFLLDRFDVDHLYTNGMLPRGVTGKRMRKVLERRSLEPVVLQAGDVVRLEEDVRLEVVHPVEGFTDRSANEHSLVMRLMRGDVPYALLPGDVEKDGIESMLEEGRDLRAEVLVLPHHGSRTSRDARFYKAVAPRIVLCSNGYLNRYGFPDSGVVADVGKRVLTSSAFGQVSVGWDSSGKSTVYAPLVEKSLATDVLLIYQ